MKETLREEINRMLKLAMIELIMESPASNPCIDKYGHILFGDFRNKSEKDTKKEKEAFTLLKRFLKNSHGKALESDFLKTLENFKKCIKQYPDILLPDSTLLYRGTSLTKTDIFDVIYDFPKGKKAARKFALSSEWYLLGKHKYVSSSPVQSWSTSFVTAADFARNKDDGVVLVGNIQKRDLIFNSKFLDSITGEDEIIRISKSPIECETYLQDYTLESIMVRDVDDKVHPELKKRYMDIIGVKLKGGE